MQDPVLGARDERQHRSASYGRSPLRLPSAAAAGRAGAFKVGGASGRWKRMAARRNFVIGAFAAVVVAACSLPSAAATVHANAVLPPSPPRVGGCQVFPASNAWNKDVSKLPVRSDSARLIHSISA